MRIIIDLQGAQAEHRHRGIGRSALSLTKAIIRNCGEHEIWVALNSLFPEAIDSLRKDLLKIIPPRNIVVWHASDKVEYSDPGNKEKRHQAECIRELFLASLQPDIVLIPSLFEGYTTNALTSVHDYDRYTKTVVVLHDLIPFKYPKKYLLTKQQAAHYYEKIKFLQKSDLLLGVSENSTQECIEELKIEPSKIVTISSAVEDKFKPVILSTEQQEKLNNDYHLSQKIVLYPGGCDPRKNMEGLIKAYAAMSEKIKSSFQLVITCSMNPQQKKDLFLLAQSAGIKKGQLILTGYVSDEVLIELYNLAYLVVFPSIAEGFGLPALEAMSCGTPVIGSNIPSISEIIAFEKALFDPQNIPSITSKLEQALTDTSFYAELKQHCVKRATFFSWDNCAKKAINAFEDLLKPQVGIKMFHQPNTRMRLAYLSPLPPEFSGISDYSAALLPVLHKYYEIDVIVSQVVVTDPWINKNCTIRDVTWFRNHAQKYDRILYHFGNSSFHQHMFSLLEEIPGVIVLHDFFLSGVIAHMDLSNIEQNYWKKILYYSHGYPALQKRLQNKKLSQTIYEYPCNLHLLQQALGVITHSQYSLDLAKHYYEDINLERWSTIPLLKLSHPGVDKKAAKKMLGLSPNTFLIASFGIIQPTKLYDRLVEALSSSKLSKEDNIALIFVGECTDIKYKNRLEKLAKKIKNNVSFTITGRIDLNIFTQYLMATDIAVQLRTFSRGETSSAVLDCMGYGIATIVNANGAMAELPKDNVFQLQDNFQNRELVYALEYLWQNPEKRLSLGKQAQEYIRIKHNPKDCAHSYMESIEKFYSGPPTHLSQVAKTLISLKKNRNETELIKLSTTLAKNYPPRPRLKQLFFDVSTIINGDDKTGIQRVVRAELQQLMLSAPEKFRIEPIYLRNDRTGWNYYYAKQYTSNLLNLKASFSDTPIDTFPGDVLLMSDLHFQISQATEAGIYKKMRNAGVAINVLVYDLIAITHPHFFPPNAFELVNNWLYSVTDFADNLICISKATETELKKWIHEQPASIEKSIETSVVALGADILSSIPTFSIPTTAMQFIESLTTHNSFLMVGTLEPRKGHEQVLSAFEYLWDEHIDANLVIIGKQGWLMEKLVARITKHSQFNKRLFWLENVSDEFLDKIYGSCTALVMASQTEGFGIPLIEAAQHHLPIIARDIPVFREIAGPYAYYFDGLEPRDLAFAIKQWSNLYTIGKIPLSKTMPWLTWSQHAEELKKKLAYTQKRA